MAYTISQLASKFGIDPRRIYYFQEQGLVDKARKHNTYDEDHVKQIRAQLKWEDERETRRDVAERCRGNDQPTAQRDSATDS